MAELSPEASRLRKRLLEELPPVIARKYIERAVGGLVTGATMANYDSRGDGPAGAIHVGDSVAYYREQFVDWLVRRWPIRSSTDPETRLIALAARAGKSKRQGRESVQA